MYSLELQTHYTLNLEGVLSPKILKQFTYIMPLTFKHTYTFSTCL